MSRYTCTHPQTHPRTSPQPAGPPLPRPPFKALLGGSSQSLWALPLSLTLNLFSKWEIAPQVLLPGSLLPTRVLGLSLPHPAPPSSHFPTHLLGYPGHWSSQRAKLLRTAAHLSLRWKLQGQQRRKSMRQGHLEQRDARRKRREKGMKKQSGGKKAEEEGRERWGKGKRWKKARNGEEGRGRKRREGRREPSGSQGLPVGGKEAGRRACPKVKACPKGSQESPFSGSPPGPMVGSRLIETAGLARRLDTPQGRLQGAGAYSPMTEAVPPQHRACKRGGEPWGDPGRQNPLH